MASAFFGAIPQTRVSGKTAGGADVVSYLAAVVTVMPLYVLAHRRRSPLPPHLRDVFAARPGAVKGAKRRSFTLDGENRCGKFRREGRGD
jgi:hypothetical protein